MNDLPAHLYHDLSVFVRTPDRFEYLRHWLHRCGIVGKKIEIQGQQHLLIRFSQHEYVQNAKIKIFVAHYDRVPNTPGANDNSAAVFQLLCHAGRIAQSSSHHNIQILFTDAEELINGKNPSKQGAYQLSIFLKSRNITNCLFYVFDMCGIGDHIVIGKSASFLLDQAHEDGLIPDAFYNSANQGLQDCITPITKFQGQSIDWIHSSFSDDLGLLLGGYPAVCISLLPKKDILIAQQYWKSITENKKSLFSLKKGYFDPDFQKIMKENLPQSWKTRHSADDTIEHLERRSFAFMEQLLTFLTEYPL